MNGPSSPDPHPRSAVRAAPDPAAATEPPAPGADRGDAKAHHGPFFLACLGLGWAVIVFGLHGMVSNAGQAKPTMLFRLLIGLNIVNDALVIPVVIGLGYVARRVLPGRLLMPAQVGLITSAVVVLYAYPLVGGWGRTPRASASLLPWNYAHNLAVVLLAVWALCGILALWSWRRATPTARS